MAPRTTRTHRGAGAEHESSKRPINEGVSMKDALNQLREALLDYCGTSAIGGNMAAMAEVSDIEMAEEDGLEQIANELGIDTDSYRSEIDEYSICSCGDVPERF